MLADLNDYLHDNATPEEVDVIAKALEVFDHIGIEDYDHSFMELLMLANTVGIAETLDRIRLLIAQMQDQVLKQFGVIAIDEINLQQATQLIKGIVEIPGHDDQQEVYRLTQSSLSPEETCAELLYCVSGIPVEQTLIQLEHVTPAFISRIKELAQETLTPIDDGIIDSRKEVDYRIQVFTNYRAFLNEPLVFTEKLLEDGITLNLPFITYLSSIGRDIERITDDRAAKECVAMALISSDGLNNPVSTIREYLHEFIADTNKLTRIDIIINDLVLRFKPNEQ